MEKREARPIKAQAVPDAERNRSDSVVLSLIELLAQGELIYFFNFYFMETSSHLGPFM